VGKSFDSGSSQAIEPRRVEPAAQTFIPRRQAHTESTMERLKGARARRAIEPVINYSYSQFSHPNGNGRAGLSITITVRNGRRVIFEAFGEIVARFGWSGINIKRRRPVQFCQRFCSVWLMGMGVFRGSGLAGVGELIVQWG